MFSRLMSITNHLYWLITTYTGPPTILSSSREAMSSTSVFLTEEEKFVRVIDKKVILIIGSRDFIGLKNIS